MKINDSGDILIKDADYDRVYVNAINQDDYIRSTDWRVRKAVADKGYYLSTLVHGDDWHVRVAVAEQGYGLGILINDKSAYVREAVARQDYGLGTLVYDEDWEVREVAKGIKK